MARNHPWMNIRKLYRIEVAEIDWEIESSLIRSEATGDVIAKITVGFCDEKNSEELMEKFKVDCEDDIKECIYSNRNIRLTVL